MEPVLTEPMKHEESSPPIDKGDNKRLKRRSGGKHMRAGRVEHREGEGWLTSLVRIVGKPTVPSST